MSSERRHFGLALPILVVLVGGGLLLSAAQQGTLQAANLRPVNYAGLAAMAAGVGMVFSKKPLMKLIGVLVCGVGSILVICL